ncbi:hypothetical protein QR680_008127 [Steinernema hermaphroditum]|uniref:Uncharacterized protein n=1 Tax=Steinernema hermaphroditum TaxID=289476 RepID=A0AA39IGX3_9BILA|nr:hypothetical protein QR680_008127 [Steinernema hermaphroditum]
MRPLLYFTAPIIVLPIIHWAETLRIRYSKVPFKATVEDPEELGEIRTKTECAVRAYKANMIAFTLRREGNSLMCKIHNIKQFYGMQTDPEEVYLLTATGQTTGQCDDPSKTNSKFKRFRVVSRDGR